MDKKKNKIKVTEARIAPSHQLQEDNMAMSQLLKMFSHNLFLPITSWSISPKEVLHICNDIAINNRKQIVEFGSGFSTICIAQLLKINGKPVDFVSIENNAEWASELKLILKR